MKQIILTLLLLAALNYADAVEGGQNNFHNVCQQTTPDDKFVFKVSGDWSNFRICQLSDYQYSGENCSLGGYLGEYGGEPLLSEIVDLNRDAHVDLIVQFSITQRWTSSNSYLVFLNCGNDTFIRIFENPFYFMRSIAAVKNGLLELEGIQLFHVSDEDYNFQKFILEFDRGSFIYKISPRRTTLLKRMTDDEEDKWVVKKNHNELKFPESIPVRLNQPIEYSSASFDCNKATTKVETVICASNELRGLDLLLAFNFKMKKLSNSGVQHERFRDIQYDQREWLKKRSACETYDCIKNVYITRIDELCQKYPVKFGGDVACYPYYPPDQR
jgi:hypothetical protein